MRAGDLFAPERTVAPVAVEGLRYEPEFLGEADEDELLRAISELTLKAAPYKQYLSRRRIKSFGSEYDFSSNILRSGDPMPEFLLPLRERISAWAAEPPEAFVHALVTQYDAGTPLGWHRDTPEFGVIVGVSLGGGARMRFRRYPPRKGARVFDLELEPRSIYEMRDEARWGWQHSIAATPALRFSITFRTLR